MVTTSNEILVPDILSTRCSTCAAAVRGTRVYDDVAAAMDPLFENYLRIQSTSSGGVGPNLYLRTGTCGVASATLLTFRRCNGEDNRYARKFCETIAFDVSSRPVLIARPACCKRHVEIDF